MNHACCFDVMRCLGSDGKYLKYQHQSIMVHDSSEVFRVTSLYEINNFVHIKIGSVWHCHFRRTTAAWMTPITILTRNVILNLLSSSVANSTSSAQKKLSDMLFNLPSSKKSCIHRQITSALHSVILSLSRIVTLLTRDHQSSRRKNCIFSV